MRRIDVLLNNAVLVSPAGAEESSIEQARSIFDTNFFGIVRMTRAVVPHMRRQGGGRIINIGSVLGLLPAPYMALYAASKHAIEGYSESLDHELRTRGIRVSVIEPAYTKTQFEANLLEADAKLDEYREVRAALGERLKGDGTADKPTSWPTSCCRLSARLARNSGTQPVVRALRCDCLAGLRPLAWWTLVFENTTSSTRRCHNLAPRSWPSSRSINTLISNQSN